jgi:hypothetical protein
MRKMILAGLAALAVTVAVAPDAQAYWYRHYNHHTYHHYHHYGY